jgi:hypothetical protein
MFASTFCRVGSVLLPTCVTRRSPHHTRNGLGGSRPRGMGSAIRSNSPAATGHRLTNGPVVAVSCVPVPAIEHYTHPGWQLHHPGSRLGVARRANGTRLLKRRTPLPKMSSGVENRVQPMLEIVSGGRLFSDDDDGWPDRPGRAAPGRPEREPRNPRQSWHRRWRTGPNLRRGLRLRR